VTIGCLFGCGAEVSAGIRAYAGELKLEHFVLALDQAHDEARLRGFRAVVGCGDGERNRMWLVCPECQQKPEHVDRIFE